MGIGFLRRELSVIMHAIRVLAAYLGVGEVTEVRG